MVSVQRATIELWMHFGGLPSTQEARVYASFVLSSLPRAFKNFKRLSCYRQWISSSQYQSSYFDNIMTKFIVYNRTDA